VCLRAECDSAIRRNAAACWGVRHGQRAIRSPHGRVHSARRIIGRQWVSKPPPSPPCCFPLRSCKPPPQLSHSREPMVRPPTHHIRSVILLLRKSTILLFKGSKACFHPSVYVDAHGETDENLRCASPQSVYALRHHHASSCWPRCRFSKLRTHSRACVICLRRRGKPLFLNPRRYAAMEAMWCAAHALCSMTRRVLSSDRIVCDLCVASYRIYVCTGLVVAWRRQ
jgi:hypothetical protein